MKIGELLKQRRHELKLTLEDVGKAVGVGKSTVKKWEDGYIANMKRDKIAALSAVLQLNPNIIMDTSHRPDSLSEIPSTIRMIPLYESVSAGFGATAVDMVVDRIPLPISSNEEAKDTICIKVTGDSMYPKIEDGDIIVVRKQSSVDSGKVAVLLIDKEESVVKKVRYVSGEDWLELHSFNPEYKTRRFEGADVMRVEVLGIVKQVIKSI